MVARGEVWWYEDPRAGRRPFLILTRDAAIPVLNQVLGAPATRSIRAIPTEVALERSDGMPEACALALDNLTTLRVTLLTARVTRLSEGRMREACTALAHATSC